MRHSRGRKKENVDDEITYFIFLPRECARRFSQYYFSQLLFGDQVNNVVGNFGK